MQRDQSDQPSTNSRVEAAVLLRWRPDKRSAKEQVVSVEIDGEVFTRAKDPAEARRVAKMEEIEAQLETLAGPEGKRARELLAELTNLWAARTIDVHDYVLRQVGYALLEHGLVDLWRLLYAELGPADDKHRPAAAADFLHGGADFQNRGSTW